MRRLITVHSSEITAVIRRQRYGGRWWCPFGLVRRTLDCNPMCTAATVHDSTTTYRAYTTGHIRNSLFLDHRDIVSDGTKLVTKVQIHNEVVVRETCKDVTNESCCQGALGIHPATTAAARLWHASILAATKKISVKRRHSRCGNGPKLLTGTVHDAEPVSAICEPSGKRKTVSMGGLAEAGVQLTAIPQLQVPVHCPDFSHVVPYREDLCTYVRGHGRGPER